MQIKKFEAQNMSEALRLIKQEFGADAVILSVRKIENGKSILGLSRGNGVEVTAATDVQPSNMKVNNSSRQYANYYDRHYDLSDAASAGRKKALSDLFAKAPGVLTKEKVLLHGKSVKKMEIRKDYTPHIVRCWTRMWTKQLRWN